MQPLPAAMVIGAHPLFMLAASARVPFGTDERHVAGGLFGAPLAVVRTPRHGIRVPAAAEIVLEGVIDPTARVDEGPFGEFTGYSSNRSTNNLLRVETVMRRQRPMLVDVVGGNSAEHLNLARIPRESEMVEKLRQRLPSVTALHYPNSGTHFHAYVALRPMRAGEARQVMLGLLGWDPYLKTVIAVDADVDITRDETFCGRWPPTSSRIATCSSSTAFPAARSTRLPQAWARHRAWGSMRDAGRISTGSRRSCASVRWSVRPSSSLVADQCRADCASHALN